jgi:23S rRNA pseudouridine1911/1915/1917 synthase
MTERIEHYLVQETEAEERLDMLLVKRLQGTSRSQVQRMINTGQIKVNGKQEKSNYKVQPHEDIEVMIRQATPLALEAERIPLDILYEDAHVIVVNKARGMVVHPAAGNYSGTLVNALLEHCDDLSGINGTVRPGIVHRLDKDTSGVMVAAKSDKAHLSLAQQIKERSAGRRYLAIVHGNIKEDEGIIKAPLGRHPVDRKKMAVVFENSKEAVTKFRVCERFGRYTLVECKLLTGRTHQIRVHMAYIGHPVVGDRKYGPERVHFDIEGQALHSAQLKFMHPLTGESLCFSAPLPEDMERILTGLRQCQK